MTASDGDTRKPKLRQGLLERDIVKLRSQVNRMITAISPQLAQLPEGVTVNGRRYAVGCFEYDYFDPTFVFRDRGGTAFRRDDGMIGCHLQTAYSSVYVDPNPARAGGRRWFRVIRRLALEPPPRQGTRYTRTHDSAADITALVQFKNDFDELRAILCRDKTLGAAGPGLA